MPTLTLATQGVTGSVQFQIEWRPRGDTVLTYLNGGVDERFAGVVLGSVDFDIFACFSLVVPNAPAEGEEQQAAFWDAVPLDVQESNDTPMDSTERALIRQAIIDALELARPSPFPPWVVDEGVDCHQTVINARKIGRRQYQTDKASQRLKTETRARAQRQEEDAL